jgi:hypothetical protein
MKHGNKSIFLLNSEFDLQRALLNDKRRYFFSDEPKSIQLDIVMLTGISNNSNFK